MVPLNVTDDAPVKPVPVIVTEVPGEPLDGEKPLTVGAAWTLEQPGSQQPAASEPNPKLEAVMAGLWDETVVRPLERLSNESAAELLA